MITESREKEKKIHTNKNISYHLPVDISKCYYHWNVNFMYFARWWVINKCISWDSFETYIIVVFFFSILWIFYTINDGGIYTKLFYHSINIGMAFKRIVEKAAHWIYRRLKNLLKHIIHSKTEMIKLCKEKGITISKKKANNM